MKLRTKETKAADADRSEMQERSLPHQTPGQRLIVGAAMAAGILIILTGLGYKFWYIPSHQAAAAATAQQKKSDQQQEGVRAPQLTIPDQPTYAQPASMQPQQPAYGQGWNPNGPSTTTGQSYPPGLIAPLGGQGEAAESPANVPQQQTAAAQAQLADDKEIHDRKLSGNMGDMPDASKATAATAGQGGPVGVTPASVEPGKESKDFAASLIPTVTPKARAAYIPNRNLTVAKGTPIRCTLDSAINSDQPGFPTCVVSRPVYSMDGTVILVDAGATIDGELTKTPARGKKHAAALWGRITEPDGVVINVDSPATDTLGAGGMTGSIDNHYCERYCGAFLYSTFEDLEQIGVSAAGSSGGNGNTNIVLPQNTMSTGNNAANEMLTQGRDVVPTFTKNQGDEVTITVGRDLDFSTVYHLDPVASR